MPSWKYKASLRCPSGMAPLCWQQWQLAWNCATCAACCECLQHGCKPSCLLRSCQTHQGAGICSARQHAACNCNWIMTSEADCCLMAVRPCLVPAHILSVTSHKRTSVCMAGSMQQRESACPWSESIWEQLVPCCRSFRSWCWRWAWTTCSSWPTRWTPQTPPSRCQSALARP